MCAALVVKGLPGLQVMQQRTMGWCLSLRSSRSREMMFVSEKVACRWIGNAAEDGRMVSISAWLKM